MNLQNEYEPDTAEIAERDHSHETFSVTIPAEDTGAHWIISVDKNLKENILVHA